jgi:hypothetical protein
VTLPTGLLSPFVFVLTGGVSTLTAVGARLLGREQEFVRAVAASFSTVGALYLAGVGVVWLVAGGGTLWGLASGLVAAGLVAFVLLGVLPLAVGRRLVRRAHDVDSETALRLTTAGWPVAMLIVFGVFVAPGGVSGGHLLSLDGPRTCLGGFCGVSLHLVGAVSLSALVAVFGPGLVGLAVHAASTRAGSTAR